MTGFHWHPAARLAGWDGALPPMDGGVIAPRPAIAAVAAAMARAGKGLPFRVGATGAPPPAAGFETLTSGSSGTPRRIARSFASWSASHAVNAGLFGIGPGLGVAVLGAPDQSLALYGAVEGLCLGARVHVLDGLRPDRQRQAIAAAGIGLVYATPAQLRLMVEAGGAILPDLAHVLVGGAKLDATLRGAVQAMAPRAQLREFYGAAEASFITLADGDTPHDAVGRAYPGVEIRIDPGDPGGPGRIWVKSPYLFHGYAGDDPGGAHWRDGWLSVGEMGRMAGDCLFLAGRAGRMVTVADQNVFPEEVETFLLTLPGILRAAVLPRPDALRGHVLVAVLKGTCADDPAAADGILSALRDRLGATRAPRRLLWWPGEWPVLPSGKTDLRRLAQEVAR